jgi:hypothetical protein
VSASDPVGLSRKVGTMLTKEEMTSLIWLRMHWEGHYKISFEDGAWQALPQASPAEILTSDSAVGLRDAMKDHFAALAAKARQL